VQVECNFTSFERVCSQIGEVRWESAAWSIDFLEVIVAGCIRVVEGEMSCCQGCGCKESEESELHLDRVDDSMEMRRTNAMVKGAYLFPRE